jgi:hypothetical protein
VWLKDRLRYFYLLGKPNTCHCVHKRMNSIVKQKPVHTLTVYFSKIYFSTPETLKHFFTFWCSGKYYTCTFLYSPRVLPASATSFFLITLLWQCWVKNVDYEFFAVQLAPYYVTSSSLCQDVFSRHFLHKYLQSALCLRSRDMLYVCCCGFKIPETANTKATLLLNVTS